MTRGGRLVSTLRAEGLCSLGRRLAEHAAYQLARRGFLAAPPLGGVVPPELGTSVLHLHGFAPKPWFGGVQVELAERRREESRRAPFALLFPDRGRLRLEIWRASRRRAFWAGDEFGPAVRAAVGFLGCERLRVENLAGLPLAELAALARAGLPQVIAVHDLAAFRDGAEPAAELLRGAEQVIYPSRFLKEAIAELCPGLAPERQQIRPPLAGRFAGLRPRIEGPFQAPSPGRPLRIAFVGTVAPHKGSQILAEVLDGLTNTERRRFAVSAYGGGTPAELSALSHRGVRLRGFYRPATLTGRLRADGIDLALLLSPVPESYGITLDECLAAGVRALAFDHGAIPERLRAADGGWLVQPEHGAEGVREVLRGLSAGEV